jgi:hypothetical protein
VRLDIRILPGIEAINQRVGTARSEPNHSPKLDNPLGRMSLSLDPIKMLN